MEKNEETYLDRIGIAEPVAHDGRSDGSTGSLEESKDKVHGQNEHIRKGHIDGDKVEPNGQVNEEEAEPRSHKTNRQDGGGVEGITELSINDISSSVRSHKDRVHGRQKCGRVSRIVLKLLLDRRVTLAREVGHEVSTKGNEEGPSISKWK